MVSFLVNQNHLDREDLPPYLRVKGDISEDVNVILTEVVQTTSSSMKVELNSNHGKRIKIDWYRKQPDMGGGVNPLSKKTMVQQNKYLCSPKGKLQF